MENLKLSRKDISNKERLYNKILGKIISMGSPKDVFLTEGALAKELGASRISIRETLITLCSERILKNIPRLGYQIVQLTSHDINDAIRIRRILELGAAGEYLPILSDYQFAILLERVEPSFEVARKKDATVEEWWEANMEFHLSIAHLARNELLIEMLRKTLDILWRANVQYFRNKEPEKYLEFNRGSHEAIVESIKSRNQRALIKYLTQDIESLKANFQVL